MIEEFAESEEFVLGKRTNDQGSIVFKMVHIVAIGLPVLVVWLAQPGSSKLYLEICQLWNLWKSTLQIKRKLRFHSFSVLSSLMSGIQVSREGVEPHYWSTVLVVFRLYSGLFSWHPTLMALSVSKYLTNVIPDTCDRNRQRWEISRLEIRLWLTNADKSYQYLQMTQFQLSVIPNSNQNLNSSLHNNIFMRITLLVSKVSALLKNISW